MYSFTISLALMSAKHPKSSEKKLGWLAHSLCIRCCDCPVRLCGLARHLALAVNWPVITGGCHVRLCGLPCETVQCCWAYVHLNCCVEVILAT